MRIIVKADVRDRKVHAPFNRHLKYIIKKGERMNWDFIIKYLPLYERAALLTVKIGVIGIVFAVLVGLVCSAVLYYKVPVARQITAVYIELSRNTPLLVQLFFIYYGLPKVGLSLKPGSLRSHRPGFPRRELYGGSFSKRSRTRGQTTVGECRKSGP